VVSPDAGGAPPYRYTALLAAELERRWQDRWEAEGTFETANPVGALAGGVGVGDRPKLYLLDMFPYPSGYGLHVGHPLGYIGTDVYGRYRRMVGGMCCTHWVSTRSACRLSSTRCSRGGIPDHHRG
jgi:valyl-tRNA synthetase